jgi:hypothetical protein
VSKQFKKYLTLHVDNSKQKNMADMWFPGLGKSVSPLKEKIQQSQHLYKPVKMNGIFANYHI